MRPVFFADFKDTNLRREQEAFLWGSDLLVIPKWSKNPAIPKGIWEQFALEDSKEVDTIQPILKMRGGSIIPLTNRAIQSTSDYRSDSLELLVCLDENQNAEGKIYVDKGDGFDYKNGDYEMTSLLVRKVNNNSLSFKAIQTGGKRKHPGRYYRIALVTDKGILYKNWTQSSSFSIKLD
jgi:alpha-glucosidase